MVTDLNTLLFYSAFFIFSILFGVVVNNLFLKFSRNFGLKNEDYRQVRWYTKKKPVLGGFSFYVIFLFSFSAYSLFFHMEMDRHLAGFLLAVSCGFLLGLADDAYGTNPFLKFLAQFVCSNILVAAGIIIPLTPLYSINYVFTVFWVVGMMNSINMLDNMDGITASAAISATIIGLAFLLLQGQIRQIYFITLLGVLGTLVGFMYYNRPPAKMYMGDTGSQFLGVFLAAVSILLFWDYRLEYGSFIRAEQFLIPALVFIVPLIDTATVVIRRMARGQSPFVGGKDHTTHHLVYLGLSEKQVTLAVFGVSLFNGGLAVMVYQKFGEWNDWYTAAGFTYIIGLFLLMQYLYNRSQQYSVRKRFLQYRKFHK